MAVHDGVLSDEFVARFGTVVLLANKRGVAELVRLTEAARTAGCKVIVADCYGALGFLFVDCGRNHVVHDQTGVREKRGDVL